VGFEPLTITAVAIVSVTGVIILTSRDWRLSVGALALQYLGVFILVRLSWPLGMTFIKLVAGWMACAVLFVGGSGAIKNQTGEQGRISGIMFRLLSAALLGLVVASAIPRMSVWLPTISLGQLLGGGILIALGLLQLSLTNESLRVFLGLLTVMSGFEILYAAVETSALVAGLLAIVSLGLAFVSAYLLAIPAVEAPVEEKE
jgi:hypothetical protein